MVRAGARDEKAGVRLDVDPGANLSVIDVVEVLGWVRCDGVDTLGQWEGEETTGQGVQFVVPVVVRIKTKLRQLHNQSVREAQLRLTLVDDLFNPNVDMCACLELEEEKEERRKGGEGEQAT